MILLTTFCEVLRWPFYGAGFPKNFFGSTFNFLLCCHVFSKFLMPTLLRTCAFFSAGSLRVKTNDCQLFFFYPPPSSVNFQKPHLNKMQKHLSSKLWLLGPYVILIVIKSPAIKVNHYKTPVKLLLMGTIWKLIYYFQFYWL